MYSIKLNSVGNPDHQQYAPVSNPLVAKADTLKDLWEMCEKYIQTWGLGGGNWTNPKVLQDGKAIGYFSYNGRLWSLDKSAVNPDGTEIIYVGGPHLQPVAQKAPASGAGTVRQRQKEADDFRVKLRKGGVSLTRLHKALRTVTLYLGKKEIDDFFEADHTAPVEAHIYGSMVVIEEYLRGKR